MLSRHAPLTIVLATACAALLATSCVGPSGSQAGARRQVVMTVGDRPVYAEDLVKSFYMRQAFLSYVLTEEFKAEAARRNIRVDPAKLAKKVDDQKQLVTAQGTESWEGYLKHTGMTEKEYVQNTEMQMLGEALVDSLVQVSDDQLEEAWEKQKDVFIEEYLRNNKLPDTEKKNVTFQKCRDMIRETVVGGQRFAKQGELSSTIVMNAKLRLDIIADPAERKVYEDLILNNAKDRAKEELKKQEEQKSGPPAPATGGQTEGGKPGEGASPGKGQPPVPKEKPKGNGGSQDSGAGQKGSGGGSKGGKQAGK